MNDTQINAALALAIGYLPEDVKVIKNKIDVYVTRRHESWYSMVLFDYKDPKVIWPIAEKYTCFPYKSILTWIVNAPCKTYAEDTAAKAVAMAVIGMTK